MKREAFGILLAGMVAFQAQQPPPPANPPSFAGSGPFRAGTGELFDLYAKLSGKTVLRPSGLPPLPASIILQIPADTNAALSFITGELKKNRLDVMPDGKFVRITPVGLTNSHPEIYFPSLKPSPGDAQVSIGPGQINFINIDLETALVYYYSRLRNRTILQPANLPPITIALRSQTALTGQEAVYAFETVLAMDGIVTVDDGDKFVQVVPAQQFSRIKTGAPKPGPGEQLFPVEKIPVFSSMTVPINVPTPDSLSQRIKKLYVTTYTKIWGRPPPTPPPPDLDALVAFYAGLAGKKSVPSPGLGKMRLAFKAKTPLTKSELLYAIEKVLALSDLEIITLADGSLRARSISKAPQKTPPMTNSVPTLPQTNK